MPIPPEDLAGKFLAEIEAAIDKHARAYSKDTFWYQFIVALSAVCGLLSLIAGTADGLNLRLSKTKRVSDDP
jgi:hypothetical protein